MLPQTEHRVAFSGVLSNAIVPWSVASGAENFRAKSYGEYTLCVQNSYKTC
jgi:hypothetical protein